MKFAAFLNTTADKLIHHLRSCANLLVNSQHELSCN